MADVDARTDDGSATAGDVSVPASGVERGTRLELASSANCPAWVLAELAGDTDDDIRLAVAGNRSTPAQQIGDLCADLVGGVATRACTSPNAPDAALVAAARDPRRRVARLAVLHLRSRHGDTDDTWADAVPAQALIPATRAALNARLAQLCPDPQVRDTAVVLAADSELTLHEVAELAEDIASCGATHPPTRTSHARHPCNTAPSTT